MTMLVCGHEKDGQVGYVHLGGSNETICSPCHKQRKREAYKPRVLRRERVDITKHIGSVTSVGTILLDDDDGFPRARGNCCDILNMSADNVEEAVRRIPDLAVDCEVEVVELYGRERVRVVDSRLTADWLRHVCDTCRVYEGM